MKFLLCIALIFLIQNGESATIARKDLLHELLELNRLIVAEANVAQSDDTVVYQPKQLREEPLNEASPLADTQRQNSYENSSVGFTAYLGHRVTLQPGQTLCFDTVITNEGLAYNPDTGEFTCPVSGLYLFSFSVGTRNERHQVWVRLTVNAAPQVDGAAETNRKHEDAQGGGSAVLKLMAGDVVSVKAFDDGKYFVDSSSGSRFNYFSGALLK